MKNHLLLLKIIIVMMLGIVCNNILFAQSGEKWSFGGNSPSGNAAIGTNNWFPVVFKSNNTPYMWLTPAGNFGIGTSNPTAYKFDVNGRVHATGNVFADSCLTAMNLYAVQKVTADALQVNNNAQLKGITIIGDNITIDGANSSISSSAGALNFGNNNLQTSGNITGNIFTANAVKVNGLGGNGTRLITADNNGNLAPFSFSGNSAEVLYGNGVWKTLPLQSPWIADNNGVYPDTLLPNRNVIVPVLYADKIFAQSSVSIGNFKFSNGGVQPAPPVVKDTISTPNKLAVLAEKTIDLISDTVKISPKDGIKVVLDVNGTAHIRDYLWVEDGIIVGKRYEGGRAEIDTIKTKELQADTVKTTEVKAVAVKVEETVKVGNGAGIINIDGPNNRIYSTSGVLDFNGNNFSNVGTITAQNLNVATSSFDSLHVQNRIKIGNSIYIDATPLTTNNIYTDNTMPTDLLIQSKAGIDHNTIINANNNGRVGIGTYGFFQPRRKLHIHGEAQQDGEEQQEAAIRLENVGDVFGNTYVSAWDIAQIGLGTMAFQYGTKPLDGVNPGNAISVMSTKMVIDNIGNVGIGIANPTAKLEVAGQVKIVDGTQGAGKVLTSDADGLAIWSTINALGGVTSSCSDINYLPKMTSSTNMVCSQIFDNGINLGIGTSTPGKKLHIYSNNADCKTALRLEYYYIPPPIQDGCAGSSVWDISANGSIGNMLNFTTPSLSTPVLTLAGDDGNVGIGTDYPAQKLHIYGESDPLMDGHPVGLKIEQHNVQNNTNKYWDILVDTGKFYINNTGNLLTSALTITEDKKIGVGTTNPSALFHAFQNQPDQIGIYVGDPHPLNNKIYVVPNIQTPANFNPIAQSTDIGIFFKPREVYNGKIGGLVIAPEYSIEGGIRITSQGTTTISAKLDTNFALTVKNLAANGRGLKVITNSPPAGNQDIWAAAIENTNPDGQGLLIKVGNSGKGIEVRNANDYPIFCVDIESQKTWMRGFKSTIDLFPDYVFEDNYNLMPLTEKEKYWKEYKHLPGFPTADEVKQEVDIPNLLAKYMKEIEEMYLHMVELKKENEMLKYRIELLEQNK